MFTAYVRSKSGNITPSEMVCKRHEVEDTASNMSKMPDVARVSIAAFGRIILSFKDGVRIDSDSP